MKHHAQVCLSNEDLKMVHSCNYQMSLTLIQDSSQQLSHSEDEEGHVNVYKDDPTQTLEYNGMEDTDLEGSSCLYHDDQDYFYNFQPTSWEVST